MGPHIVFDASTWTLSLLDQRVLPAAERWVECHSAEDVVSAIQAMVVRGAPALGVTTAYGCALACRQVIGMAKWRGPLERLWADLAAARPTAVNPAWAVGRIAAATRPASSPEEASHTALEEARRIHREDIAMNQAMGRYGAALLPERGVVMTHCNAGALATGGYGTALGVIRAAWEMGKDIRVIANETRPFLQGARLTAYELRQDNIPVEVVCDNACALLMARGEVDAVVVGADRIAACGDTANKIGTLAVAIVAKHFGVPLYVAAPTSTIDLLTLRGEDIPIEERPATEVTHVGNCAITPPGVPVRNLAFDVTPAALISAIITERGVLTAPLGPAIRALMESRS